MLWLPDDDTLVALTALHEVVSIVGNGEDVRRQIADLLVLVPSNVLLVVDVVRLVRVDGHEDTASVGLFVKTKKDKTSKRKIRNRYLLLQTLCTVFRPIGIGLHQSSVDLDTGANTLGD